VIAGCPAGSPLAEAGCHVVAALAEQVDRLATKPKVCDCGQAPVIQAHPGGSGGLFVREGGGWMAAGIFREEERVFFPAFIRQYLCVVKFEKWFCESIF